MSDGLTRLTSVGLDLTQFNQDILEAKAALQKAASDMASDPQYQINLNKALGVESGSSDAVDKAAKSTERLATATKSATDAYKGQAPETAKHKQSMVDISDATTKAEGASFQFLKTITDKARWLAAFYLVTQIKEAFTETLRVITETETAVVELQRVLNEDVGDVAIQGELYDMAIEFGRTFEEVSDTAVKFAQTGAEWAEVLDLTRATMLAVNTAELEVEDATTGLIAVISQFNLEASDMESIIDQINKTADNFPVTSEKIVDALQRAGGAADNAGLSLQSTIALITGMSEELGRSGANIGTALNSLINFSSRASSLDVFAQLGGSVADTVERYRMGAASIAEVWQALSVEINNLDVERQAVLNELFASEAYGEFADQLEAEATDITSTITDVYTTAGTLRQNYFIGLLGSTDTYEKALEGMLTASNYSVEENVKVMNTLAVRFQVLRNEAELLAVAFSEESGLSFFKGLTSALTELVKFVGVIGGIPSLLNAVWIAFLLIKQENIAKFIGGVGTAFVNAGKNIANKFNPNVEAAAKVSKTLSQSITGWTTAFAIGTLAVNAIVSAIEDYNEKQREMSVAANDRAQEVFDELSAMQKLSDQYKSTVLLQTEEASQRQVLGGWVKDVTEAYALEAEQIEKLNDGRQSGIALIAQESIERLKALEIENQVAVANANRINEQGGLLMESSESTGFTFGESVPELTEIEHLIEQVGGSIDTINSKGEELFRTFEISGDSALDIYKNLERLQELLNQQYTMDFSEWPSEVQEVYTAIEARMSEYEADYQEHWDTINDDILRKAQIAALEVEELYGAEVEDAIDAMSGYFDAYNAARVKGEGEAWDAIQSYVQAYIRENGEAGELLQDIVNGVLEDYANAWVDVGNEIVDAITRIEQMKEATEGLLTQAQMVSALFAQGMNVNNLVVSTNVEGLTSELEKWLNVAEQAEKDIQIANIRKGFSSLAEEATADFIAAEQEYLSALDMVGQIQEELANLEAGVQLPDVSGDTYSYDSYGGSDTEDPRITAAEEALALAEAELEFSRARGASDEEQVALLQIIQQKLHEVNNLYRAIDPNEYATDILANSTAWWDLQNEIVEIQSNFAETQEEITKNFELNIEALEREKEAIEDRYQAQIDALRDVEQENDRIRAKEEYYERLDEASKSLAEASARSGVEYREQEADIMEEISDINKDWNEQLEDWRIDDQIEQLESLRDAELEVIDRLIDALSALVDEVNELDADNLSYDNQALLESYKTDYMIPATDLAEKMWADVLEQMEKDNKLAAVDLSKVFGEEWADPARLEIDDIFIHGMVSVGESSAQILYEAWRDGWIQPISEDFAAVLRQFQEEQKKMTPSMPTSPGGSSGYTGSQNNYNNTRTTNNTVVNLTPTKRQSGYSSLDFRLLPY